MFYVAVDGEFAGLLAVADRVKPTTPGAISALKAAGLRLVMLTGDHQATAEQIGRELAIDEVIANVRPEQKADAHAQLAETYLLVPNRKEAVKHAAEAKRLDPNNPRLAKLKL